MQPDSRPVAPDKMKTQAVLICRTRRWRRIILNRRSVLTNTLAGTLSAVGELKRKRFAPQQGQVTLSVLERLYIKMFILT